MKKILMDLSIASAGMSGIPQDAKWLYKTFAQLEDFEVTGLLYSRFPNARLAAEDATEKKYDANERVARWLSMLINPSDYNRTASEMKAIEDKEAYDIIEFPHLDQYIGSIWRQFFAGGLIGKDKEVIEKTKFVISNITNASMHDRVLKHKKMPKINTSGYDFIVHEDSRPMKVSKGTKQIMRYHDALPLTELDTFSNPEVSSLQHYRSIKESLKNGAYYVTNSEYTRKVLCEFFPIAKKRSCVIPYAISSIYTPEITSTKAQALSIIQTKQAEFIGKYSEVPADMDYVLAVATIEPRKNYINLMRAFCLAQAQFKNKNTRLVICGAMGWNNQEIVQMMRLLTFQGKIIYLQNVHPVELKMLYHHAKVFVYPTLAEGFGLPPIEALACGTPVISSDIPVHHEIQGDASWYVDPYDIEDIAENIKSIVNTQEGILSKAMEETINKKMLGFKIVKSYQAEVVSKAWSKLFNKL